MAIEDGLLSEEMEADIVQDVIVIDSDHDSDEPSSSQWQHHLSNEGYLVGRARAALAIDPFEAKAWMLTAQTLFPQKFNVQFEAYQIEKSTKNIREAAKCFTALLTDFPNEVELCSEVQAMTTAVRQFEETEGVLDNAGYLVKLFYQLPPTVQRSILLSCAEKTPDDMDHCKLMLLFFRKFPTSVLTYGPGLMENLITAEKHSPLALSPINNYRKLLVCDLLPLLGQSQAEIVPKSLHRLLDKAVEFYLVYAFRKSRREDGETLTIDDPWQRLWEIILSIGTKLGWELTVTFGGYWNKDSYVKAIGNFSKARTDEGSQKQVALCALLTLLRCVHEYQAVIEPANGEPGFTLVEAFRQADTGMPLKPDEEVSAPVLTVGSSAPSNLVHTFLAAVRCLEVLHSNEYVNREYCRLQLHLKADTWLRQFSSDAFLYQGFYNQVFLNLEMEGSEETNPIIQELTMLTCCYWTTNHVPIPDHISKIAGMLPNVPVAGVSNINGLSVVTRRQRHLHYLPLTKTAILNYCVKILLAALKQKKNDLALGHILVLIQLNWPAECEMLSEIADVIQSRGGFSYPVFTNYIINVDILEQFSYLASDAGPKVPLDIFPVGQQMHSQRRMSTRGVDKGAREDFRIAIRGQIARSNEPVDELVLRFLKCERDLIQHSLRPK